MRKGNGTRRARKERKLAMGKERQQRYDMKQRERKEE
jgi:hypothetical protein